MVAQKPILVVCVESHLRVGSKIGGRRALENQKFRRGRQTGPSRGLRREDDRAMKDSVGIIRSLEVKLSFLSATALKRTGRDDNLKKACSARERGKKGKTDAVEKTKDPLLRLPALYNPDAGGTWKVPGNAVGRLSGTDGRSGKG